MGVESVKNDYQTISSINNPLKTQNIIAHAKGGIFTQPHIGLVAEAGREAIIPLENRANGIPLLMNAAHEMGLVVVPEIKNAVSYADSIFSDSYMRLITNTENYDGNSLENRSDGISLWEAANTEMRGFSFGGNTINNDSRRNFIKQSPVNNFTINVYGGESGIEQKIMQAIESYLAEQQDHEERVNFIDDI